MTPLNSNESRCNLLTLPDPTPVKVNLHRVGGVKRLMIVEDEDVAPQRVDTS